MKKKKLDTVDYQILRLVQDNARITNSDLSKKTGISAPPTLRRLRALENEGVIEGYHAWQFASMESFFDDDSFNEILIYTKNDANDNISHSSSTTSSDEIQKDDDKYLSYSEKKILNGIQNNEKLLKEILEKLNNLNTF